MCGSLSVRVHDLSHKKSQIFSAFQATLLTTVWPRRYAMLVFIFHHFQRWDFIISKNQYKFHKSHYSLAWEKANISRHHHWFPSFGGETSGSIAKCRLFSQAICSCIIQFHRIAQLLIRAFNFNLKFSGFLCFEISFITSVSKCRNFYNILQTVKFAFSTKTYLREYAKAKQSNRNKT